MDVFSMVLVVVVLLQGRLTFETNFFISPSIMTFNAAKDYCKDYKGRLILVNSLEQWEDYQAEMDSPRKCSILYWTGLKLDSACRNRWIYSRKYNKWITLRVWTYSGWAKWDGADEPNGCPEQSCVILTCAGMKTRKCGDAYRALCKKDALTTTQNTQSWEVTSSAPTQTAITPSAEETSDVRTTSQTTPTVGAVSGVPTTRQDITADGEYTSYNSQNDPVDGATWSSNNCRVKNKKNRHLDQDELQNAVKELKSLLAVNKTNLTVYRCKLISVYDSRPSSVAIGVVASAILIVIVGMIVIPDIASFIRYLYR